MHYLSLRLTPAEPLKETSRTQGQGPPSPAVGKLTETPWEWQIRLSI